MLKLILRKMLNNPWMILCLLFGYILAVAIVSSIPMYTDGVLQRMLTKDLENYQLATEQYPGRYYIKGNFFTEYDRENRTRAFLQFDEYISNNLAKDIGLPLVTDTCNITLDYYTSIHEKDQDKNPIKMNVKLDGVKGLENHINLIHGRLFSREKVDEYYEVIVTEQAMKELDLRLNESYLASNILNVLDIPLKLKVVGVFTIKDPQSPFWFQGLWAYKSSFLLDYELLRNDFIDADSTFITSAQWHFAFNYHSMTLNNINAILDTYKSQHRYFSQFRSLEHKFPVIDILGKYSKREAQLKLTLWMLQAPILLMLALYLFMVSQLIIDNEKNEIAVMKSRGAGSSQIFLSYLLESGILSIAALAAGPPLGLLLCNILGASNGFLEFVKRTALPLRLSIKTYQYSFLAILLFMAAMLIPALYASKTTIVEHKRNTARARKEPAWKKFFLDFLMLAVSGYGLYSYNFRQGIKVSTGLEGTELSADPLLFLITAAFIIGMGLLFLRVYPYMIKLMFITGKKYWSPVLYSSFIHVSRSGGQNQFLMLFIIMTLAIGLFNANAARTLNTNTEDRIKYEQGADLIIEAYWPSNASSILPIGSGSTGRPSQQNTGYSSDQPIQYQEPPFEPFKSLEGIETATKVLIKDNVTLSGLGQRADRVRLMGVVPDEFGKSLWFRKDLLPYHINDYLNLLAQDPRALLLSSSFQESFNFQEGDSVFINWGDQGHIEGIIYAFIDYWPSYNPMAKEKDSEGKKPYFIAANYSYIRAKTALEPYYIWLSKEPGSTSQAVYDDIVNKNIPIRNLMDTDQQIISIKNDPMLQGTNGVLTLGFIVTMAISTIGFIIYWILSIQRRILSFGIFRAMGLTRKKVIGMLISEQILISGIAIAAGIILGSVSSRLFVPLLQIASSAAQQILPFRIVTDQRDYFRVYALVALMLIIGVSILGFIISKIKIAQALKLGED